MDYLQIRQSPKLFGEVAISGAKNAALPLLALSLLSDKPVKISNLPNVADVKTLTKLLEHLGANVATIDSHSVEVTCEQIIHTRAIYDIVRKMRASILVLGPLLTRFRTCEVSLPGGCAIGARPVDLHLKALEKMGAQIHIQGGYIIANAPKGLKGADILFDKISVTGSENIIMAATLARGKTRIINAAKEPEVVQLCEILRKSGIEIEGIGSNELLIHGSDGILPTFEPFSVIPDRIEAGTYLCAGAITNSEITLKGVLCAHLKAILDKLEEIGFSFEVQESKTQESEKQNGAQGVQNLRILSAKKFNPFELVTTEYPGFPTDMQAQFMALATQCEGVSVIEERLFENRFMHVSELQRLGADIKLTNNIAKISGKRELFGASVMATDLRASSALVLAGLVAQGETQVHRIYHLDRGYEALEQKFLGLGADIARLKE
ncbi:UDP-N-acetylglucosamine 1-carboxyvinyltransferase [Helicobacter sp. MIT 00-7814]|uniref:UDP-N-acetylglucosamine 1-carboxyvinyltransferase n=1 Tax=unclassified Helicobacter TaxID=2593540 RepID=UPI000E1ED585|nr:MULTISPECIES: UDP-N-acetylglucosamine 1-carboxyvinyltransferase [unclassified Helicobacter]RDU55505.1 UDP-N-acetylglucosamine 1-carboxyvinyltransferase [Helicobacter sp. MIT 99-10781]RDU55595.1 UDP-N-acetylglucosamine 1-carboxyvinyltransferase [Helicobacter sp. MIT 00-7814]